jgi:hypothetical protein
MPRTAEPKYAVRLRSKYTGEERTLGMRYDTEDEAEKMTHEDFVCHRCNNVSVVRVWDE